MFIIISLSCPRVFKQGNNLLMKTDFCYSDHQSSLKRDRGGKSLPSPPPRILTSTLVKECNDSGNLSTTATLRTGERGRCREVAVRGGSTVYF